MRFHVYIGELSSHSSTGRINTLKYQVKGHLAGSVGEHVALDLKVLSLSPTLGIRVKNKIKYHFTSIRLATKLYI